MVVVKIPKVSDECDGIEDNHVFDDIEALRRAESRGSSTAVNMRCARRLANVRVYHNVGSAFTGVAPVD